MKQQTELIVICSLCLLTFVLVKTAVNVGINYFENKDSVKQEIKTDSQEKVLGGMNYNNGEGWYKNCKVKMFYDGRSEKEINKFISEKDIVDIKVTSSKIVIVYIEPSLSEDIIIEEK